MVRIWYRMAYIRPMDVLFIIIVLIVSVILHEVSHGYAANMLGDPTARLQGRLTLNPISHIDPIGSILIPAVLVVSQSPFMFGYAKPVPYNPYNLRNQRWGEAIVAVAGPLTNLGLALFFGLIVRLGVGADLPGDFLLLAEKIVYINLFLACFNLIPIPPLDGSKVLSSVLPYKFQGVFQQLESLFAGSGFFGLVLFLLMFSVLFAAPFQMFVNAIFVLITGLP